MSTTPDLGLPELVQGQSTPHVTFNVALFVQQMLMVGVIDRAVNTPAVSPTEGDSYIVGPAPTGAWAGRANCIAGYYGAQWRFLPCNDDAGSPITMGARQEGLTVWVKDESKLYVWSDTASSPADYEWREFAGGGGGTPATFTFSTTDVLLGRDTAGGGAGEEIAVGGGLAFTGTGGIQTSAFTGDVTKTAGGTALTIANNAVTDGKFRQSAAVSVVGRSANSSGNVADIAASANGQYLNRRSNALSFDTIPASDVVNTPAGAISAVNLQAAINELDTEKVAIADAASASEVRAATATNRYLTPASLAQRACFNARLSANQTGIADNTETKVQFNTEDFDIGGWYDNATNYRCTPQSAMMMQFGAGAGVTGTFPVGNSTGIFIKKNGSSNLANGLPPYAIVANDNRSFAFYNDTPNGTTDYYEAYVIIDTSSGTGTVSGNRLTFFTGAQQ